MSALLHTRFPLMFDSDHGGQFFPLPAELPRFLREKVNSNPARWLILELFQHLSYRNEESDRNRVKTIVRVSDATLEERSGINRREIKDARRDPSFRKLVSVVPGEQREKGKEPVATVYDLKNLMIKFNTWLAPAKADDVFATRRAA